MLTLFTKKKIQSFLFYTHEHFMFFCIIPLKVSPLIGTVAEIYHSVSRCPNFENHKCTINIMINVVLLSWALKHSVFRFVKDSWNCLVCHKEKLSNLASNFSWYAVYRTENESHPSLSPCQTEERQGHFIQAYTIQQALNIVMNGGGTIQLYEHAYLSN